MVLKIDILHRASGIKVKGAAI